MSGFTLTSSLTFDMITTFLCTAMLVYFWRKDKSFLWNNSHRIKLSSLKLLYLTEKNSFSSGQMTTYNVYQLKIHEFLSINIILREGYLWQIPLAFLLIRDICLYTKQFVQRTVYCIGLGYSFLTKRILWNRATIFRRLCLPRHCNDGEQDSDDGFLVHVLCLL